MKRLFSDKWFRPLWKKIETVDYFQVSAVFSFWFFLAYLASSLAGFLGINSTYIRYITGHDAYIYTPFLFWCIGLGVLGLVLGYGLVRFILSYFARTRIFAVSQDNHYYLSRLGLALLFLGLISKLFRIFSGTYFHLNKNIEVTHASYAALIGLGEVFGILGLGIVWAVYYESVKNTTKKLWWHGLALAALAVEFLFGFFSLSKMAVLLPVFCFLFIRHYMFKKSFIYALASLALLQLVVFPVQSYLGTPGNIQSYQTYWKSRVVQKGIQGKIMPAADFVADGIFGRFDLSRTLGKIILKSKETNILPQGNLLKTFFISLGPPRLLWPQKPQINTGHNEFGRRFELLSPDDYTTSMAPGLLGDLYLNFGVWGIVLGTMIIGGLLGLLGYLFLVLKNSLYWLSAYATLIPYFLSIQEGWLGPGYAGLIKYIGIFIFLWLAVFRWLIKKIPSQKIV